MPQLQQPKTGAICHREGTIDVINAITGENAGPQTISVAFSSEMPVERSFGYEILSHDAGAVDLSRLNDGAPLLLGHEAEDQIGVVESATIDADRVGRAVVRFSRASEAQEIWQDVVDGIRRKVSVGYVVTEYQAGATPGQFIATRWQPLEISIVSIPADNSVGVGRNLLTPTPEEVKIMTEEKTPAVDVAAIRADALKVEQSRVADITKTAKRYGLLDMAADFVADGKSADEFHRAALEALSTRTAATPAAMPATHLDMSQREVKQYSMMRAIRALSSGSWKGAELEKEASLAVAEKLGRDARGFFVPWEVQTRAQNTGTLTAGGALVATNTLTGSFIELLRAKSVVVGLGAQMLSGLVGNVDIPKQTGASTAYWVGEDGSATDSEATFGTVQLSPRTIANAVPITRRMLMQTDMSVDALITADIANVMALAVDLAILEGNGVNKPLGIVSTTGVNTQSVASAGAPTWAELVGFESAVDTDNALVGNLAYVTTPAVKGTLKTTKKDSGSGIFLLDGGVANGYQVATTTQLTTNRIIFGNFADVIIANWGVLDIMQDMSTKAASGGVVIRAFQDLDAAVRHAESFCINA